jgi:YfiH family protein
MILYSSKLFAKNGFTALTTDISLDFKRDNPKYQTSIESVAQYINNTVNNIITVRQVHETNIVNSDSVNDSTQADGIISVSTKHCLAIKTADCIPLVFADPKTNSIMILHCGRKGIREGIIQNGIKILKSRSNLEDVIVYIGPSLHLSNHLVFEEELVGFDAKYYKLLPIGTHIIDNQILYDKYLTNFPEAQAELKNRRSAYLDLPLLVVDLLIQAGIKEDNIDNCNINSYTNLSTHSYRRDAPNNGLSLTTISKTIN